MGENGKRTVTLWRLWIQNTTLRVQEISALVQTGHIDISAGESGQLGTGAKSQRHFYTGVELAALFDASPEVSNVPSLHKDNKYTIFSKDTSTPRCQIDFFLLLWRTPLERCCVHHAPPVITNSCLPSGRYKANVLLAKVCLHCTKPGVARSS